MNQFKAICLLGNAPKQRAWPSGIMFGAGKQNVLLNREVVGALVTIVTAPSRTRFDVTLGCNRFAHVVKVNDANRADTPKQ